MENYKFNMGALICLSIGLMSCSDDKAEPPASDSTNNVEPGDTSAIEPGNTSAIEPGNTSVNAQTALKDLPAECKGFEVLGLKNSPGGMTLPNKCAPFDSQRNNPYAIRCIDADPDYKTKYAGDDLCILPPPPELGTQVHVGPQDYDNPGEFELAAGAEETRTYYIDGSTDEDHYFYRTNARVRRGAHHMVISSFDMDREDGWGEKTFEQQAGITDDAQSGFAIPADGQIPADFQSAAAGGMIPSGGQFGGFGSTTNDLLGVASGNFGVQQRVDQDRPQGTLEVPPENDGLGGLFKAKQQMSFNLHYINTSEEPTLREVWVNIWYKDEGSITAKLQPLNIGANPADVAIPARQRTVLTYQCDVASDTRIITLYGHRHAHTDRFSIWIKKASGETFTAYESFSWEDMPTYQYDSVSSNPVPDVDKKIDGASSGELTLEKGDQLFFECDINNQLDVPLKFAFETITGEMCIVFGSFTGETPCGGFAQRVLQ